jgi:hypothetical protein
MSEREPLWKRLGCPIDDSPPPYRLLLSGAYEPSAPVREPSANDDDDVVALLATVRRLLDELAVALRCGVPYEPSRPTGSYACTRPRWHAGDHEAWAGDLMCWRWAATPFPREG